MGEFGSFGDPDRSRTIARNKLVNKTMSKGKRKDAIEMNPMEQRIAAEIILPGELDVTFSRIGGLEMEKEELYDLVILPLKRPGLFKQKGLASPPKGILLYGEPGTGKTMLAKALACESGATFINIQQSTLVGRIYIYTHHP